MTKRHFGDWLHAYCEHTQHLEAPTNLHFFSGVAAVAGALRRHVWFDQGYFKWYPNFYIIIVADPGIVNKSTSIGVAMDLLREVPGVHLGPSSITWQALVQHMGNVGEQVDIDGKGTFLTQSCLSFVASELGTLIDFRNREMIDVLVDLWDGKTGSWEKMSKMSGTESVVNPWISLIAGTTPAWLAANVPESAVGGGFTSRCLFIFGREKRHLTAYPKRLLPPGYHDNQQKLIADLEAIALLRGEYKLTKEAEEYGQHWYEQLWTNKPQHLEGERFKGYVARKQTHLHKLCMVLSASEGESMVITKKHFNVAETLFESVEDDMLLAMDRVGRSEASLTLEQFLDFLATNKKVKQSDCYRYLARFGDFMLIQNVINTAITAGLVKTTQIGNDVLIECSGTSLGFHESARASEHSIPVPLPSRR